mgnify:CR=1 FL=1
MKLFCKDCDSKKKAMFLLLAAAGVMEFLFITLESLFSGLAYYVTETYLIVPALLFFGYALMDRLPEFSRRRLLLAGAAIAWFVVVQIIHRLSGMDTHPIGTVFFVYLMAFPFASVTEDKESLGLKWIGGMFLTASLVLVAYGGVLLADLVPESLGQFIFWDGARLHVFWHPNISACFFMLGIGFAAAFLVRTKRLLWKLLLLASIILQMALMAMTNCRTTLLLTGAMLGAILFLAILQRFRPKLPRKSGKRNIQIILLCLVLVLTILAGFFLVAGKLYQRNNDRLLEEAAVDVLETDNPQNSLTEDMRTLNGRIPIWKAAFSAIRDNKRLALFGTEYSGTVISVYNSFEVVHGHNAWVESLLRLGLPGLLLSLAFTALAVASAAKLVLNPGAELWKKILAVLTMCLMATGFLEPYLFITNVYYHVTDFAFFFLTGYLDHWANQKTV